MVATQPVEGQVLTPDWVKEAVFCHIFPDRFATSSHVEKPPNLEPWEAPPTRHGFKGGDLLGWSTTSTISPTSGVNALYFCPIFQSTANHRYHTHDYYQVDPILGGNAAFTRLLDAAHRRGMRVILDGVFNHASRGFYQFNHLLENGPASPYLDWFPQPTFPFFYDDGPAGYQAWWGLKALPSSITLIPRCGPFVGCGRVLDRAGDRRVAARRTGRHR